MSSKRSDRLLSRRDPDKIRLWGNPKHMSYVASALRDKHSTEKLHILVAKTNSDNYTYDGIDLGAERVANEIETYVEDLRKNGKHVKKLSIVGYSLGGLVARYVIGLLCSKGFFERIRPLNFTTFAAPHLGVRTPILGVQSKLWNFLGSSTLSVSGRQLFLIDRFKETGMPLIAVLAESDSVFIRALRMFKNRVLYANCINDRSAPYYTTSISMTDPFQDLDSITMNYLPGYAPNILDPKKPISLKPLKDQPPLISRIATSTQTLLPQLPLFALLTVLIPVGSLVFLINSGIQSVRSSNRIRLHEEGKSGSVFGSYKIPLMVENARATMETAIENVSPTKEYSHTDTSRALGAEAGAGPKAMSPKGRDYDYKNDQMNQIDGFPTMELSPEQFSMIKGLDEVGFKKYRVHIHKVRHSHAAIVVRTTRRSFDEGKVVMSHWLEEEFEI